MVGLDRLLTRFPAVRLSHEDRVRVSHGQEVSDAAYERDRGGAAGGTEWVRLLDGDGHLVAVATGGSRPGALHPAVVLI